MASEDNEYDTSLCAMWAENNLLWTDGYLYKKEYYSKDKTGLNEDEKDIEIPF